MSGQIGDNVARASGVIAAAGGGGKVLQVVQTAKDDSFSTSSATFTDITGMSVAITPTATTSKIMITTTFGCSGNAGNTARRFLLLRDTTPIALPSVQGTQYGSFVVQPAAGNDQTAATFNYLDSPSTTSATTYKLQMCRANAGSATGIGDRQSDAQQETVSTITATEIGA